MNCLRNIRYRIEALAAAEPRLHAFAVRSFASTALKVVFVDSIKRGDVVFDVGANRGIFTSFFSNLVGSLGKVHAFEPSSTTCEMLLASLQERTVHDNVIVQRCAVADARGSTFLRTPGDDDGQASLIEHSGGSWSREPNVRSEQCEIITLDEYVEDHRLERVDFVKIDVEGAERLVINGFLDGLRRFRPILTIELCSLWSRDFGYQPAELIMNLQELGYDRFEEVGKAGHLREMRIFDRLEHSGESIDVVCSVSSFHGSRLSRLRKSRL